LAFARPKCTSAIHSQPLRAGSAAGVKDLRVATSAKSLGAVQKNRFA
jgi:hypothetical protein